jgi:restriction system protein
MKNYYRVMLGKKSIHAEACFAGGFIGADFGIDQDLTRERPEFWKDFNRKFVPIYLSKHPDKTKVGAGLACGFLHTITKAIQIGDIVLSPDGEGSYRIGEITGNYRYASGEILPHRRPVRWLTQVVERASMSEALRNSADSIGTVCDLSRAGHEVELNKLIGAAAAPTLISSDTSIEDPGSFALEKHLEDFLVENWAGTDLGKRYDIYRDETGTGQQFRTDTGAIDILAVSKDGKELLVVELKKGRASDAVVGQTLRYMSFVQEELAEKKQKVRGVIIALEDDPKLRRALKMTPSIEFFRYQISFKLVKA